MRVFTLIIFIFLASQGFAQESLTLSKIKLNDGSEFTATIIENQPGKFIKIKFASDQYATIDYAQITLIRNKNYNYHSRFELPRGLYVEAAYAFMFGKSGEYGDPRIGMSLGATLNYRFNPYLAVGAGADVNTLFVNSNYLLIPVYARVSGSLATKLVSPYYMLDIGWSSASTGDMLESDYEIMGGAMVRPEVGVRINKVRIGLGYQIQKLHTSYTNDWWWGDQQEVEEQRTMRNIRLGISVIF